MSWEQKPLLECVDLLQGLTYSPDNVKSYGILVLRSSNVKNSKIDFEDCVFVNCSVDENKYVQPNDILICVRNGSSALIGKSCVIDKPYNATFGAFMSILRGDKTGYVAHVFASDIVQSQIRNRSSATINQITKRDFEDIVIPIPAEETEQRRIAEALSNTDALLAAMEKLIAKKRAIKQGAMQELLTGKRRLPRFEGEWVETTLGKVVLDIKTGKRNNEEKVENGRYAFFVRSQQVERINDYSYDCEAILVPGEGNIGQIFHYVNGKFDCHQRVYKISEFVGVDAKFIYYYMKMFFGQYALANTVKATVDSLRLPTFVCFGMSIPSSKKEQTAIAEILSDMDAEIDALAAKLNKLRNIKQGMMSELLTGRIRLADSAPAKATVEAYPEQEAEPIHQVAEPATKGHDQQFDDAVMIAGIVNVLYSDKYPIGRKKVQKCLYLLRRHQDESTEAFKKKAADPYADEVRYKGGEPIARKANYIATTTGKQGTTFVRGKNIGKALGYIQSWGRGADIKWVADKLKFKSVDELELLATVDMAICDLAEAGTTVSIESIKHLIAANAEWKAKLKKQIFSDANIARAILELNTLLQGCY